MNVANQNFTSIEQIRNQILTPSAATENKKTDSEKSFQDILTDTAGQIKFSKHASQRLATRNMDMSEEQKARLQEATNQAKEKGIKESLVMVDNFAFIVNVKKNTVVTAVNDTAHAVFTNIDGAIIN